MLKTMLLYRITNAAHIALLNNWALLNDALGSQPEFEPTGSQWRGIGFAPYAPSINEELVWSGANGVNLFTLMIHERNLTAATIREHVLARGKKIEDREQRKVYRNEYAQIKDEVIAELLPKAFLKHRRIPAMVIDDLLIVGASSAKLAEDFLCTLREAMGSLAVRPLSTKMPPAEALRRLMQERKAENLALGDTAKLVNELKDTVTFKGVTLTDDEPQTYLSNGFVPKELALFLDQDFYFKLTDTLIFKGMKFSDKLIGDAYQDADGDHAALIDADIILTTNVIRRVVQAIADLAGEDRPKIEVSSEGLKITHINNVPLEDLMTASEKLLNLQQQFAGAGADIDEDEDF